MILVTGGTGLIGSHLLLFLTRKGLKPRALYRNKKSIKKTKQIFSLYSTQVDELFKQIEWVKADITDVSSLQPVFKNIQQVYHAAALVSFDAKDKERLHQINVEGTANMLNLAIDHHVKKFLHLSSIAALGSYDNPITEHTHWNWKEKHSEYAVTKHLSEMEAWRATQEGLPVVILNPSVVLGAGFENSGIGLLLKKIKKGMRYYPPGGNGFVDVWDLVKVMTDLMNSPIVNESFIVSAYDITYKKLLQSLAQKLSVKEPTFALPKTWAYIASLTGIISPSFRRTLWQHPHYSAQKLLQHWPHQFIPFEASIANMALQLKKQAV